VTRGPARPLAVEDLGTLRERKRILDLLSMATLIVLFLAAALPWFLRALALPLAPAARTALTFTLLYWAAAALTDRIVHRRGLLAAAFCLQASALIFQAVLWRQLGGLQSPIFLLASCVPVAAAGFLLVPWQAVALAVFSVLAVSQVALVESPELRWYLSRLGLPGWAMAGGSWMASRPQPFPGVGAQPAFVFVLVEAFAVLQLACAGLCVWLARSSRRLQLRARPDAVPGDLLATALRAAATPTALVEEDDGRVLLASDSFSKQMLLHGEALQGRSIFELMRFAEPGRLRELLRAPGGMLPLCSYAIGAETRVARVEAYPVAHQGWRYACVRVEDLSELSYLGVAVRELPDPVLVIGPDGRLQYGNHAAERLFGELYLGLEASVGLTRAGAPEGWWSESLPTPERMLEIEGARYTARVFAVGPTGERVHLVTLRREAPAESAT